MSNPSQFFVPNHQLAMTVLQLSKYEVKGEAETTGKNEGYICILQRGCAFFLGFSVTIMDELGGIVEEADLTT